MEAALLIPTPLEARLLSEVGLDVDPDSIFITGMGVVASGVLSAKWLLFSIRK